jgi:hypothetical protein
MDEGATCKLVNESSDSPYGSSAEELFTASLYVSDAALTTNCRSRSTLTNVSLASLGEEALVTLSTTLGGLLPTPVKKENGAKFTERTPFTTETVDTNAIGRGTFQKMNKQKQKKQFSSLVTINDVIRK